MPKFLVTIRRSVIEEKCVELEAADKAAAERLFYSEWSERLDGFEPTGDIDRWLESVEPWMDMGELESESSDSSIEVGK